jgi:hypothetical protein
MNNEKLVDVHGLLEELFPPECRPTPRWVRDQQKHKTIPFVRLGRLIFFDVNQVREAIARRHTIKTK